MENKEYLKYIDGKSILSEAKIGGMQFWLSVRNHFYTQKRYKSNSVQTFSFKQRLNLFKMVFIGLKNWLLIKKFDYWFFTDSLERRDVEGKAFDKLVDYPAAALSPSLVIELPKYTHDVNVASNNRASRMLLVMLELLVAKFVKQVPSAEIEQVAKLLEKEGVSLDVKSIAIKMLASYKVMKYLLKIKKPKAAFFVTSYTNHGYIKALKEIGVKVVEFQHGVINEEHYGYNLFFSPDQNCLPDYLLSFGNKEVELFSKKNQFIKGEHVIPIGSFYIDYINHKKDLNQFLEQAKKGYKLNIGVSLQDCETGKQLIPFLIEAAHQNQEIIYLLKPRTTSVSTYQKSYTFPENIKFVDDANVYEVMKQSDLHLTAYSSCILEAPALGKRNLAINLNNRAKEYYGDMFQGNDNTLFIDSVSELIKVLDKIEIREEKVVMENHKSFVYPSYKKNIQEFLNTYIHC